MPTKIIVTGATGFLGSHFVYSRRRSDEQIYCVVRGKEGSNVLDRVWESVEIAADSYRHLLNREDFAGRLHAINGDLQKPLCGVNAAEQSQLHALGMDEFWHFASSLNFEDHKKVMIRAVNIEGAKAALELARVSGVKKFIYVSTAYTVGSVSGEVEEILHSTHGAFNNYYEESKCQAEHMVTEFCREHGIGCCILRPSIVVGPRATLRAGGSDSGLYGFVREVWRIREVLDKTESGIELAGDPQTSLNLVPVDDVIADIQNLKDRGLPEGIYHATSDFGPTIRDTLRVISEVVGCKPVRVNPSVDLGARSPIERLMDKRTVFYNSYLKNSKLFNRTLRKAPRGITVTELIGYVTEFTRILRKSTHEKYFKVRRHRHADGSELSVYRGVNRDAEPVLLINAVGMPVEFWCPLAEALGPDHDLITWESRGVPNTENAFDEAQVSHEVQLSDLKEVLASEGIESCHVVAWCTGVQLAVKFAALYPSKVKSLTLLNGCYNFPEASVPRTEFEKQLRVLLPKMAVDRRYAELYYKVIYGNSNQVAAMQQEYNSGRERLSSVISSTDPELVHLTSLPYRSPELLYRYSRVTVPYYNEDVISLAPRAQAPTLVVTGDEDQSAHHEGSIAFAKLLPNAQLYLEPGSDHFSFYRDPTVVAKIRAHIVASWMPADEELLSEVLEGAG